MNNSDLIIKDELDELIKLQIQSLLDRYEFEKGELIIPEFNADEDHSAWCGGFSELSPLVHNNICPHCKGDIRIRNPKGYCDHLYWPNNCETCQALENGVTDFGFFKDEDFDL